MTNPPHYLLYVSLLLIFSCAENELPLARPGFQVSDYQRANPSRRFDQCTIRYAFRNRSKTTDPATLQKELEVPFDRWSTANGYLTFEQVTAASQPADITIMFADTLRPGRQPYTSFGLIGQPVGVLSQLVRSTTDSSCTIYLSGTYAWDATSLQRVLLFQLGAALGLATSINPASAMSGQQLNAIATLDSTDRTAIQKVYNQPCDAWTRLKDPAFGTTSPELAFTNQNRAFVLTRAGRGASALWEYLLQTDSTRTRSPLPGLLESFSGDKRTFAINDVAYVGIPFNTFDPGGQATYWRYQPARNQWDTIAPLPRKGSNRALSYALGNKGYVVMPTGFLSDTLLVWQYDPATNTWAKSPKWTSAIPSASALESSQSFTLNDNLYLISVSFSRASFRFDPTQTPAWTPADSPAPRELQIAAAAFSVRNYGFCITEWVDGRPKRLWRYEPDKGWTELKNCPIAGRITYTFTSNNRVYVGTDTGQLWRYTP